MVGLGPFYIKEIFILYIEWSSLAKTDFRPFGISHSKTGPFDFRTQINNSKTELVQLSDVNCTYFYSNTTINI
jgi:hypothetical protein